LLKLNYCTITLIVIMEEIRQPTHEEMEREMLESTRRTLRDLNDAETAGMEVLANLAIQNEQLDNVVINLDKIRTDVAYADLILKKIASPFNFTNLKTAKLVFETAFGTPATWSGVAEKSLSLVPIYKTYFFVIASRKLLQFSKANESEIHKLDFSDPKECYSLKGALIISHERKSKIIVIRSGEGNKIKLRCKDDNGFVGWSTMIERAIKDDYAPRRQAEQSSMPLMMKQFVTPLPQSPENSNGMDIDAQVDNNLGEMMKKLDNLSSIAFETKQNIEFQNKKLDLVEDTMAKTSSSVTQLQGKHGRRLRKN